MGEKNHNLLKVYFQLVAVAVSWGGAFVAAKIAVTSAGLGPFTAATLRFALASALLSLIMGLKPQKDRPKLNLKEWVMVGLLGLSGIFGYNALFFTGLKYTSAISGSLIVAINPVVTIVLSVLFLKEKVRGLQVLGITASFVGVVVVVTKASLARLLGFEFNHGDLILLGAPFCWATYSILGKLVMSKLSALASTTYACIAGTVLLLPFALIEQQRADWQVLHLGWQGWLSVTYMAVFASVLGFVWWYQGIAAIGPSKASMFINMVPLSNLVLSSVILSERVLAAQLAGAALVIAGVYLTSRVKASPAKKLIAEVS